MDGRETPTTRRANDMYGISAQVSLYPLGQDDLSPSIDAVTKTFARHGIERQTGAMSTLVWGDDEKRNNFV